MGIGMGVGDIEVWEHAAVKIIRDGRRRNIDDPNRFFLIILNCLIGSAKNSLNKSFEI